MIARWSVRLLPFWLSVAWSLYAPPAHAGGAKILFVTHAESSFSARVRAELESMGFELVEADELDEHGRSRAAAAANVIESPPPRRVELWLQNPANGQLELKTVVESSDDAIGSDASEPVRVAERVRAFFQPLQVREPTAPTAPTAVERPATVGASKLEPMREPEVTAPASSPRFFEELAPMMALQGGSPGVDALIRGGFWLLPRFAVSSKLALPLLPSTIKSQGNSATLSATLVGAELTLLVLQTRPVRIGAQAGLAFAWLRAVGQPTFGYTNTPDTAFAALPSLGSQLDVYWGSPWHACFGAELGIALPRVGVAFAGQGVARWGRPLGLLSSGFGLDF